MTEDERTVELAEVIAEITMCDYETAEIWAGRIMEATAHSRL